MLESTDDLTIALRLQVLRTAESLGSVTEACRRAGISRGTFYAWRRRYEKGGEEALADRRRGPRKRRPRKMGYRVRATILGLARARPWLGCHRLAGCLREKGLVVSYQSVHQVLRGAGLSRRWQREERLEHNVFFEGQKLGLERRRRLARSNPCAEFLGPLLDSPRRPGELVVMGVAPLWNGLTAIFAVDWYSTFAWARIPGPEPRAEADAFFRCVEEALPTPLPGTTRLLDVPAAPLFRTFVKRLEPRPWRLRLRLYLRDRPAGPHPWIQRVVDGADLRTALAPAGAIDSSAELQRRLDAYNQGFTTGRFPDWGLTPAKRLHDPRK